MTNRVFWGAIALAVAAVLGASSFVEAARRQPNRDAVLIGGHDGVDQQMVQVDDNGNISVEFGASATAFTVGGPVADDAAASGNPVPIGCHYEATTDLVDDGDIARVNCNLAGAIYVSGFLNTGADGIANTQYSSIGVLNSTGLRPLATGSYIFNGTTIDRQRTVVNATDSTGTGIAAAGILAQFDDTSPTTVTENQFGNLRMSANGVLYVGGAVADNGVAAGNPVPVACNYNSTLPTYANLDVAAIQCGTRGSLNVTLTAQDSTSAVRSIADNADGVAANANSAALATVSRTYTYNGTTYDRERNNTDITVLASAARTATTASSDLTNYNNKSAHIVIDATAAADTPSVVCTVQGKDALSGQYYTILASAAITGISTTVLRVGPGLTAAANTIANDVLPRTWRVNCVAADGDSLTYSIGASLVVG